jgi:magnesium transporter
MADFTSTIENTIEFLLDNKKYNSLRDILTSMNPADVAALFDILPKKRLPLIFRLLPKELAAESFVEMDGDMQEELIRGFSDNELKAVIDELYLDDAVDLVEEMPANVVNRILLQADTETRRLINEMLKYPEDSAGSIMTTEYVDLRPSMTVAESIKHIRRTGLEKETINVCYVTDDSRKLIGVLSIRDLIVSSDETEINDIMEQNVISVNTLEDQETVVSMFAKYSFTALPVVDGEGRLVGIVTVDDAIDVLQEEATEDIEKMAAITPSDKPYLKQSVFDIFKSRIPWLLLLMISATFTGAIITHFEDSLSAYIILVASIPMLMDTGGNCGSQSSVTIIRGLSLQEITFTDTLKVMWKEFRISILCGITLAIVNFVKMLILGQATGLVAMVISLTLVFTVIMSKMVGCLLPIAAKRIGFDPAVMASPIITTVVDAMSLLIYFEIARAILKI